MIVKSGKVKIVKQENENNYGGGVCEVEILVLNANGRNWVTTTLVKDSGIESLKAPYRSDTYRGIDPENEASLLTLLGAFTMFGVKSYEWVEPMTEVPSQGGGSGITILDVYPVGAEFTTTDTTFNPMKVWGGTWTLSLVGAKRVWTRTA